MSSLKMGRLQHAIMRVLWKLRRANARQITEELNRSEEVAHSTVQTLLRKLEQKGSIAHDVEDRTFVFYALVEEHSVTKSATRELIDRVFDGDAAGLVAHLLKEESIPPQELNELRKLLGDSPQSEDA